MVTRIGKNQHFTGKCMCFTAVETDELTHAIISVEAKTFSCKHRVHWKVLKAFS